MEPNRHEPVGKKESTSSRASVDREAHGQGTGTGRDGYMGHTGYGREGFTGHPGSGRDATMGYPGTGRDATMGYPGSGRDPNMGYPGTGKDPSVGFSGSGRDLYMGPHGFGREGHVGNTGSGRRLGYSMYDLAKKPAVSGFSLSLRLFKSTHKYTPKERMFLEAAEKGDKATLMRCLQPPSPVNVNVTNMVGRSALTMAVDNENIEIVELLLGQPDIKIGNALLYAIREGVYRIVEMMVNHPSITPNMLGEEWCNTIDPGEECFDYSPDISPVILAAQLNQFEILQLLLSQGANISKPHNLTCECDSCTERIKADSLRYSLHRISTYRALASPAWISLTSTDPILTAFRLSWELFNLAQLENEFKEPYLELVEECRTYAVQLLDQCRSSEEVIAVLNQACEDDDSDEEEEEDGAQDDEDEEKLSLNRLKLALKYEQKQFVSHPHCQQLLTTIWYESLPGWRKRNIFTKVFILMSLISLLPFMAFYYILHPRSKVGRFMRNPFMKFLSKIRRFIRSPIIKFLSQSGSFAVFLILLTMASPREENMTNRRGPPPSTVEVLIVFYVAGMVWNECKQLWEEGLHSYVREWWNWMDFMMNSLYLATISLRLVAYVRITSGTAGPKDLERSFWPPDDPTLISEGLFSVANVFSFFRIIYLFQANPHLGPLQISLGCMLIDIGKFLSVFFLVLMSFAFGLNQLYGFYADTEECLSEGDACQKNPTEFLTLGSSFQALFWSLFGLTPLTTLELKEGHRFVISVGSLLLGAYHIAAIIMLLNMLIAMMSTSFQEVENHADLEWKFARTKLWLGYFDEGSTLPPPYNIIITPKSMYYFIKAVRQKWPEWQDRMQTIRRSLSSRRDGPPPPPAGAAQQHPADTSTDPPAESEEVPRPYTISSSCKGQVNQGMSLESLEMQQSPDCEKARPPEQGPSTDQIYQSVMQRLVRRYIHRYKQAQSTDGVSEDDLAEIKQDISSLRFELREDRRKEAARGNMQIEQFKRDVCRMLKGTTPSGRVSPAPSHLPVGQLSHQPSLEMDDTNMPLGLEEIDLLRREITSSLRSDLYSVMRELLSEQRNVRFEGGGNPPAPPYQPASSQLYQTQLYTEL
ncbi:transient-receptor-potential-like protein isoform X1 [Branchiostoma floridae x Branchiostoma belcheri]